MADTIREIIIQDIMARLVEITVDGGYNTDIGARVYRVRKMVDPEELPACVVWPQPETAENGYGQLKCKMQMRVEGIADFGTTNASVVAEKILGDLKKCLLARENETVSPSTGWSRSPDYIDSIIYTGGGTDEYPEEGALSVGTYATFEITYYTKAEDPYTQ